VNDRNTRHRRNEPAWPTGDEPGGPRHEQQGQERTGFWSPLWEDDDEQPPARPNAGAAARQPAPRTTQVRRPGPPTNPGAAPTIPVRPPGRPGPGQPAPAGPTVVLPGARQPRDNSQDPTQHIAPVPAGGTRREPDLLTHREGGDEEAEYYEEDDLPPSDEEARRLRRKKIWRRVRRGLYVFTALMIIGPILAFLIAYQMVTVPTVEDLAAQQTRAATLKYADGSPMAQIIPQDGERRVVQYGDIPKHVLNAVFAAEDNSFMTNPGFDITGVMGAAWNQVTGGGGGGSGITQQYVKQATGNKDKTLSRKAMEVVQAYKMNRTYSKEDIITAYLNTIYLGRASYGIASAAKAWYGKELKDITPSEAALLAGMIQLPGLYKDTAYVEKRWNYVMGQLVANGWFPAEQRKTEKFPTPVPYEQTRAKKDLGPRGLLEEAVLEELKAKAGLTKEDILAGGYTIETTIDPTAQKLAEEAVAFGLKGQPANLQPALVAIDPKTGSIKAYYGGAVGNGTNWASSPQEPGSSFKPFDLVALLKTGKGLGEIYDSSVNTFPGRSKPVGNASKPSCKECTVAQAMKESLNTVFYNIAVNTVGVRKVAEAAKEAGVTSPLDEAAKDGNISIGGGATQVSTVDMASAYATFAARGTYRAPHIVSRVLTPDGGLYWQAQEEERPAFDTDAKKNAQIARNVTEALLPIPQYSKKPCADGRLCAAKTGTHQLGDTGKNAKAWMVGYTPQLSTAVSLSGTNGEAISDAAGGDIFGAKVPGTIWQKFMDSYHKTFKLKKEDFGAFEPIGKESSENATGGSSTSRRGDGDNGNGGRPTTTTTDPQGPTTTTTTRTRPTRPTIPTIGDPPGPGEENNNR
jgi:membrane peptidoglycan carboxypeptidase